MTQEALLIRGYPVKYPDYAEDINDVENVLNEEFRCNDAVDGAEVTPDTPRLIMVRRAYDSIDLDDYAIYVAYGICSLSRGQMVDPGILGGVLTIPEQPVPPKLKSFLKTNEFVVEPKFGLYTDLFDCDRDYYVYS